MIDQISPLGSAIAPVGSTAAAGATVSAAPTSGAGNIDFAKILGGLFTDTTNTLRAAEATSIAGVKGQVMSDAGLEPRPEAASRPQGLSLFPVPSPLFPSKATYEKKTLSAVPRRSQSRSSEVTKSILSRTSATESA